MAIWVIVKVDLDSERPGEVTDVLPDELAGRRKLDGYRAKRGPWKDNPIVHALMPRSRYDDIRGA